MNKLWIKSVFALSVALFVSVGGLDADLSAGAAPLANDSVCHQAENDLVVIFQCELLALRELFSTTNEVALHDAQVKAKAPVLCAFFQRELDAVLSNAAHLIKFDVVPFLYLDPREPMFFNAEGQSKGSSALHIFIGGGLMSLFAQAPQRLRFFIAHEIGHQVCGHFWGPRTHLIEHEADLFAIKGCGIDQKDARAGLAQRLLADNLQVFLRRNYKLDFQQAADVAVAAVVAASHHDQLCGKFERAPNLDFIGFVTHNLLQSVPQKERINVAALPQVLKTRLVKAFKDPRQFNEPLSVDRIKPLFSNHPTPAVRSAVLESGQLPA